MNSGTKCYLARPGDVERRWYTVDATDQVLGRLAVKIANVLMGKNKPTYTPHVDTGDYVIVLNAGKVRVTGRKAEVMEYQSYSGYVGGQKRIPYQRVIERHPDRVLREAVRRMLPKNKLARTMLDKLKLYEGDTHPHQAQQPEPLAL